MSILEPCTAHDADDPLLDAVLGLYNSAHRARAVLDRLAPEIDPQAEREAAPDAFLEFLLGIVAASEHLERVVDDLSPSPAADARVAAPSIGGGSLWR